LKFNPKAIFYGNRVAISAAFRLGDSIPKKHESTKTLINDDHNYN